MREGDLIIGVEKTLFEERKQLAILRLTAHSKDEMKITVLRNDEQIEFSDTVIMKSLEDMHSLLEQENTAVYPVQSENLPTLGG